MPILDVFADIFGFIGPIVGLIGTVVKYTVQWGKYLLLAVGAFKILKFLGDSTYRNIILTNAAKKIGLITDQQANFQAVRRNMLTNGNIMSENTMNAIKKRSLGTTILTNIQEKLGLATKQGGLLFTIKESAIKAKDFVIDKASLALKYTRNALEAGYNAIKTATLSIMNSQFLLTVKESAIKAKDFILEKASLAFKYTRNALEITYNAIKRVGSLIAKSELLKNIGSAAMKAIQSLSSIPVVGWALGLAAAGATVALGYKFMKGDDVMSEGGYGNRTLLTPKGSIALNNEDTVIAGTNLGGRGNTNSTPAQQQDNSSLLEELRAMRQEQSRSNNKSVIVENSMNGTRFGTAVAMNTYKIQ